MAFRTGAGRPCPIPRRHSTLTVEVMQMERKFEALVVGADEQIEARFEEVLDDWGWQMSSCPGPAKTRCPLMNGGHCALRDSADAAIVFIDPSSGPAGALPKVRCAADHTSPYVLALEGRYGEAEEREGGSVIGAGRGIEAVAYEAVSRLWLR